MSQYKDYTPDTGYYEGLETTVDTSAADTSLAPQPSRQAKPRRRTAATTTTTGETIRKNSASSSRKKASPRAETTVKPSVDPTEAASRQINEWGKKITAFFHSPATRGMAGLFVFGLGAYLIISLISFLASGFADQSEVESLAVGNAKNIENLGGEGGARLSQILIDDTFGIGSIVIAVWLLALSFKLFGFKRLGKFRIVNFTIKCLVALITISLIAGTATVVTDWHFNLGGAHGRYINQELLDFVGGIGVTFVCIFMVALFVVICLNDLVQWALRKKAEHAARKAEREAARQEELRIQKEKEEMVRQEAMEQALAGETHMPEGTVADTYDTTNVDFEGKEDKQQETAEIPVEEDLTYVYIPTDEEMAETSGERNSANTEISETGSAIDSEPTAETVAETKEEVTSERSSQLADEPSTDEAAIPTDSQSLEKSEATPAPEPMKVNINHISTVSENSIKEHSLDPRMELPNYHFPPVSLLRPADDKVELNEAEQLDNQAKIRKTLLDFGVPIVSIEATVGPTVTLYEIVPEDGVKIASIRNLVDNIALNLAALGVRIIAPIPGKGTVGIEVANKNPRTVSMRSLITSRAYQESKYELPLAIGSTISNEVYIADLAKMPHLLVAGATGQGKSVGLNAIIASLLYRRHPSELKLVLVDPKRVEFGRYKALEHHYLAKMPGDDKAIVTDMTKVLPLLSSLCVEMENRYQLLENADVVNIKEYNSKYLARHLNPDMGHTFLPYIVVIVDEYADLLMTVGKEVEKPLARLAQKARAVGIHLIVATQRPSADVVTGMIKANFPSRIAFRVTTGVDSKTILNTTAAYQLIGRGDMLISTGGEPERVQCAFIDTPEVKDMCDFISQQPGYYAPYELPEPEREGEVDEMPRGDLGRLDPLTKEIGREVVRLNTASTSALQRRYSIGFTRAGKIMDQLERLGVVGPAQGGKPRSVLVDGPGLEAIFSTIE